MTFANTQATVYNDKVVRQFAIMTIVWGVVGMLVGVIIAAQLAWPELNFGIPWLSYGRLRPLHTNAVIFAFGGSGLIGTSYYVVQRTCQVRLFSDKLAAFTFWGWQLVIVAAAISLPLGYTTSKEYAELEWPIDLAIAMAAASKADSWSVIRPRVWLKSSKLIRPNNWVQATTAQNAFSIGTPSATPSTSARMSRRVLAARLASTGG